MAQTWFIPPIAYDSRSYEEVRDDLVALIPAFCPEWTDHNPSDMGIVLLQLFAAAADVMHFYADRAAGEAFLPTAIKRESVINLLKLIDYQMRSASSATVDLTFTLAQAQVVDVTIPEGTRCQSTGADAVTFVTTEELVIAAGDLTGTVGAIEGTPFDENPVGVSNGNAFQQFVVTANPVVDASIDVLVDESGTGSSYELWTRVDNFIDSVGTDEHYRILRDANEVVTIEFGDNSQGKIPITGSLVRMTGRVGGGIRGNVGANIVTVVADTIYAGITPIVVNVTNADAAVDGEDRETIEEAKIQGPRSLRALGRAVSLSDYEALTQAQDGVLRAKASLNGPTNEVFVYVLPPGGGPISTELKERLEAYLLSVNCVGTDVEVFSAEYIDIELDGVVTVKTNYLLTEVEAAVDAKLAEFFALTSEYVGFGKSVFLSDLYRAIDEVDGVDHVDLTALNIDPMSTLRLVQWSGGTDYDTTTGAKFDGNSISTLGDAVEETWTITFVSSTEFSVVGSVSGVHANGFLNAPYVAEDGLGNDMLSFELVAGTTTMNIGDYCQFKSSRLFGNITIQNSEVVLLGTNSLSYTGGA